MQKGNLLDILNVYLKDDGLDRDIVCLANDMAIEVRTGYTNFQFTALTKIDDSYRAIFLNRSRVNDENLLKFILAYQLAEIIKYNDNDFYSIFMIEQMESETYLLAKDIFDRSNKYKKNQVFSRIKKNNN